MNRLLFLDALCDTRVPFEKLPALRRLANDLTPLMIWMGDAGDRVLSRVELPDEYVAYVNTAFPGTASTCSDVTDSTAYEPMPWGWSAETVDAYERCGVSCAGPDLAVVAAIGSRAFCATFNQQSGTGVPGTRFCRSVEEVLAVIPAESPVSYVVKPEFSSSGAGFIHCVDGNVGDAHLSAMKTLLKDGNGVVVEPWCDRTSDFSTVAFVNRDGSIGSMRHQRNFTTRLGVYYGNMIDDADAVVVRYRDYVSDVVSKAAVAIAAAGYYGPVGFDHIIYRDLDGEEQCAAVVDINPRLTMANLARSMHLKISPNSVALFRFTAKKRLPLPDSMEGLVLKLGDLLFDPVRGSGVVPLSSPRIRHRGESAWCQPFRSAWGVFGRDQEEVFALDERLRNL